MASRETKTDDEAKREKRRARWKRNKRDERQRKKPKPPAPPSKQLIEQIWSERDRRHNEGVRLHFYHPYHRGGRGTFAFQCDVWAVRTLLTHQLRLVTVSSGKIAAWMKANGFTHGYSDRSLRTMVWKALDAISDLEEVREIPGRLRRISEPAWQPFHPT